MGSEAELGDSETNEISVSKEEKEGGKRVGGKGREEMRRGVGREGGGGEELRQEGGKA